jgi:hypothetical protein
MRAAAFTSMLFLIGLAASQRPAAAQSVNSLRIDGDWCPGSHCNNKLDDFQQALPLVQVESVQRVTDPRVSPSAGAQLGCTTGETMAVCAYNTSQHPALVAYDYSSGNVLWTSPLEDLPASAFGRVVTGLLQTRISLDGSPEELRVFAGNPSEIVAYDDAGVRLWKRLSTSLTPEAPDGIGTPVSIIVSSDRELIGATPEGWVVKLDPVDGSTIDAYQMTTNIFVNGELIPGKFITRNGLNLHGNVLYLLAEFVPDPPGLLALSARPVHIVRLELSQPGLPGAEREIKPLILPLAPWETTPDRLAIGFGTGGGSPPSVELADGDILIVGDADLTVGEDSLALLSAVVDDGGVLKERWRSLLGVDQVTASPALDPVQKTLIVGTLANVFVFQHIDALSGFVQRPEPLDPAELVTCGNAGDPEALVVFGSPIGLAFDDPTASLVVYTNFRIAPESPSPITSFLGAFSLPTLGGGTFGPLWCEPLAVDVEGNPAPGLGTLGQAALFEYQIAGRTESGLIVNTFATGTFIMRSDDTAPVLFFDGFESGDVSKWSANQ